MRTVQTAFKYRIYPNQTQQDALSVQFGHARFVWNQVLAIRNQYYSDNSKGFGYQSACGLLGWLKEEHPWLTAANAQVLQQKLKDQQTAMENFFRRVKQAVRPAGFPKFKGKHGRQSIRYPQPPKHLIQGNRINLSKVGWVKIVLHRPLEGKVKSVTVSREPNGDYFVSVLCEVDIPEVPFNGPELGIDLGLSTFATFSNEEPPEPIHRYFQESQQKLTQLQRKLARQKKGSNRYARTKRRITRLHSHIANQRADFQHKLSAYLTGQYGFIAVESLNVKGMVKNRSLARAVHNAGWRQFVDQLEYKGDWYGCEVQKISQWFPSTKLCHNCGTKNPMLTLSDRHWVCPACGSLHDRDANAARNILDEGLRLAGYA